MTYTHTNTHTHTSLCTGMGSNTECVCVCEFSLLQLHNTGIYVGRDIRREGYTPELTDRTDNIHAHTHTHTHKKVWRLISLKTRALKKTHDMSVQNSICEQKRFGTHKCLVPRGPITRHSVAHQVEFWNFGSGDSGWCLHSFDWSLWILTMTFDWLSGHSLVTRNLLFHTPGQTVQLKAVMHL